jgi:thiamine pyrophosphate-dependent acetolactate synthase large subunit-like protein
MAAAVHSNVGLLHASMAIFNAYCDRVPVLVLGATGPLDAARRRPWIDWIHTSADQAALVRPYLKWDDQPASLGAAVQSIARALSVAATAPRAPAYLCFDVTLQERRLEPGEEVPRAMPLPVPSVPAPGPEAVEETAERLLSARSPVVLAGRVSRRQEDWDRRVELAERLGALVLTDRKVPAAFPTGHPCHGPAPGVRLSAEAQARLRAADAVLSLDWVDVAGTLQRAGAQEGPHVVSVSLDAYLHDGWSKDHQEALRAATVVLADPDVTTGLLLEAVRRRGGGVRVAAGAARPVTAPAPARPGPITMRDLGAALMPRLRERETTVVRVPIGWPREHLDVAGPLDFLGADGGAGVGSGPGLAVGTALALRDSPRLVVAVLGDGDFLMGAGALWTAAHHRLPLLVVVADNRSYFNDELHQERIARDRGRPAENRHIGQRIDDPAVDIAAVARAQGLHGIGPVGEAAELAQRLDEAIAAAEAGAVVVVDVLVEPGYDAPIADVTG